MLFFPINKRKQNFLQGRAIQMLPLFYQESILNQRARAYTCVQGGARNNNSYHLRTAAYILARKQMGSFEWVRKEEE